MIIVYLSTIGRQKDSDHIQTLLDDFSILLTGFEVLRHKLSHSILFLYTGSVRMLLLFCTTAVQRLKHKAGKLVFGTTSASFELPRWH